MIKIFVAPPLFVDTDARPVALSVNRMRAAAERKGGIAVRVMIAEKTWAAPSVQVPDSMSGKSKLL